MTTSAFVLSFCSSLLTYTGCALLGSWMAIAVVMGRSASHGLGASKARQLGLVLTLAGLAARFVATATGWPV